MVTTKQEAGVSKYTTPSLRVARFQTDVITASGVVVWSESWGSEFEQSRENTWQGTEG